MVEVLVVAIICWVIPWVLSNRAESIKRQEMYNQLNSKSYNEAQKWKR